MMKKQNIAPFIQTQPQTIIIKSENFDLFEWIYINSI